MKKRWVLAATLLLLVATAISAAAHRGGKQRVSLTEQLGLTEEQQAAWDELKTAFMEQHQVLRDEYHAAFEALLTDEQLEVLEEVAAEGSLRCKRRGVSLTEQLGLTEDQQAAWAELRTPFAEQRKARRDEYKAAFEALLTDEQLALLGEIKAGFSHGRDKVEDAGEDTADSGEETADAPLQAAPAAVAAPTAVEGTSWGELKDTFSR